jgi:integrase
MPRGRASHEERAEARAGAPTDLATPGVQATTSRLREEAWSALVAAEPELVSELSRDAPAPRVVAEGLIRYGQALHDRGAPVSHFRTTLLAVQDRASWLRPSLRPAWKALSKWQVLEPGSPHIPIPRVVTLAIVVLAFLEKQEAFAVTALLMFFALLRPSDALGLRRQHVCLPEDHASDYEVMFLAVLKHKARQARTGTGAQHATVRDRLLIAVVRRIVAPLEPGDRVYPGTAPQFTRLWKRYCAVLGISAAETDGYTPASCRAGGATWLYSAGMPPGEVQWLLRHDQEKTGRHYIQAAVAAQAAAALPPDALLRVTRLVRALPDLLAVRAEIRPLPPTLRSSPAAPTSAERRVEAERESLFAQLPAEPPVAQATEGPQGFAGWPLGSFVMRSLSQGNAPSSAELPAACARLGTSPVSGFQFFLEDVFTGLPGVPALRARLDAAAVAPRSRLDALD